MIFQRQPVIYPSVENVVPYKMNPLPAGQILAKGMIGTRLESNIQKALLGYPVEEYLRTYHSDRMARWPAGEYLGKYMQADALSYQYSGKQALADQMSAVSEAWISSLPEDGYHVIRGPHEMHERWKGAWEVWELKYMLVGLLTLYQYSGDERLIAAACRIGDCLTNTFGEGEGQLDLMEVGALRLGTTSVLEPMVDLYRWTGERRYLDFCEYIMKAHEQKPNGTKIISELLNGTGEVDQVGGPGVWQKGKAYEMLSSFIGVLRMYQLTGREEYLQAMLAAWRDIVENRLFITGTAANHEFFLHKHVLPAEPRDSVGEGCVTSHWMWFNRELFGLTGDRKFVDQIEITIYNALLASQDPNLGLQSYFTPLNGSRSYEMYGVNTGGPPCCNSSVAREISRIPSIVWAKPASGGLALLLFSSGSIQTTVQTITGQEAQVGVEICTDFPKSGRIEMFLKLKAPQSFSLLLRVPGWCSRFQASVRGNTLQGSPGSFLNIIREWQPDDEVTIVMDIPTVLLDGFHAYPFHHAIRRGPQVLAVDSWLSAGDVNSTRIDANKPLDTQSFTGKIPPGWTGDQFYVTPALTLAGDKPAVLVPFVDAGQLGWTYDHNIRMYGAHTYRVWIKDHNAPPTRWIQISNDDPGWVYSGEYTRETKENAIITRIPNGESMTIRFKGQMVKVMGAFERSHADITIDCELYRDIKWYPMGHGGHRPFQSRFLSPGEHILKIFAKGTVSLDYIEVLQVDEKE